MNTYLNSFLLLSFILTNSTHAMRRMEREEPRRNNCRNCLEISTIAFALIATYYMHGKDKLQVTCIRDFRNEIHRIVDGCELLECKISGDVPRNSYLNKCISPETNYSTVWVCEPGSKKLREVQNKLFETGRQNQTCSWYKHGKMFLSYPSSKVSHAKNKRTQR